MRKYKTLVLHTCDFHFGFIKNNKNKIKYRNVFISSFKTVNGSHSCWSPVVKVSAAHQEIMGSNPHSGHDHELNIYILQWKTQFLFMTSNNFCLPACLRFASTYVNLGGSFAWDNKYFLLAEKHRIFCPVHVYLKHFFILHLL